MNYSAIAPTNTVVARVEFGMKILINADLFWCNASPRVNEVQAPDYKN
jgi:hypothetical protein